VIEVIGLVAFGSGCAICARLGFMRGKVIGQRASLDMQRRVLHEAEEVMKVSQQAHKALEQYEALFAKAKPILEEHTWHIGKGVDQ
jgi:hypothetical protein